MNSKCIILSSGETTQVDIADFEYLNQFRWYKSKAGYVCRSDYSTGKRILLYMHRVIMKPEPGYFTDHINFDKLDNRRRNLRICSTSQNNAHRRYRSASGYRGVHWVTRDKVWRSYVKHNKRQIYVGDYQDKDEAARAYNEHAKRLHGEFAMLNDV